MKKINLKLTLILVSFIMLFGIFLGFSVYLSIVNKKDFKQEEMVKDEITNNKKLTNSLSNLNENPLEITSSQSEIVNGDEAMTFEYFYKGNNDTQSVVEKVPPFLIGKTKQEIEETYSNWQLLTFDEKHIVLRKTLDGVSGKYYIIGEHKGLVAVFYKENFEGSTLKQITDTPLSSLSDVDQKRIKNGIEVYGDAELMNILQDYGS